MAYSIQLLLSVVAATFIFYVAKFIRHRRFYSKLPGPPHDFVWGHLKLFGETLALFPPQGHYQAVITTIAHKYKLPGLFYIDLWPLGPEQLIIADPELATQYVTCRNLPKHQVQSEFLDPILGEGNIVASNGACWKRLHDMLAPAFSTSQVLRMAGSIAHDVKVFHNILCELADSGKPFRLPDKITALGFDIIFKETYGSSSNAQTEGNGDLRGLDAVVNAVMTGRQTWNPFKKREMARNRTIAAESLDNSIIMKVRARFDALQQGNIDVTKKRGLGILDLILRERIREAQATSSLAELDSEFIQIAVANIKAMMLAGTGTATDTLCFMFMLLSAHPGVVEKLRQEHNQVYPFDVEATLSLLESDPQKLNELDYTTKVIKETLRIYPIGNTGRAPDVPGSITYKGKQYPTSKTTLICPVQHTWHMNAAVFPDPDKFDPDRFTGMDKASQLAWRPFERGNRACLGQSLAMDEMKMVSLLTIRYFEFKCYGLKPNEKPRVPWTNMDLVFGDRAFQEFTTEAKPRDGMMMTVTKVKTS